MSTSAGLIASHIYYFSMEVYYPSSVAGSFDLYWPIAEPGAIRSMSTTASQQWVRLSGVFDRTSFSNGSIECRVDYNNEQATAEVYISAMMLIDLTAAFGAGHEPSKEWCDRNIEWFDLALVRTTAFGEN